MRRRDFLGTFSGAAAWPVMAWAQNPDRMRRIGVLIGSGVDADDADMRARIAAFEQGLQQLGWTNGRNVQIVIRFGSGNAESIRRYAAELVALAPDVILTSGAAPLAPILQTTRTVPIVFVGVGVSPRACNTRLDREPKRSNQAPICQRRLRPHPGSLDRASWFSTGPHCRQQRSRRCGIEGGNPHRPNCFLFGNRSGRNGIRHQLGAAGREHHGLHTIRVSNNRQMAGDA